MSFMPVLRRLPLGSNASPVTTIRAIARGYHRPCLTPFRPRLSPRPQLNLVEPQRRSAGTLVSNARDLWREHPFHTSMACALILFGASSLVYANYYYQTYIIGAFAAYPEEVAKKLRRALYFTNVDFDAKTASKYYKQALEQAQEIGMDPLSDEILGIKIKVAELMEKIENIPKAIEVLEIVARDCVRWQREFGSLPANKKKRTRVLAKTVAIHIKLGELYSSPYVWDLAEAESRFVWAVETILKEKMRRRDLNVDPAEEGEWVTDDEFGASLEALAHGYEARGTFRLAAPLFLQALTVKPVQDCHSVVLMNNLAAALAEQGPVADKSARPIDNTVSARAWAEKALEVAARIQPPVRTEECDTGCAVALYNLGDFAERAKDLVDARKKYAEALSLAKAVGFDDGVKNCRDALHRLKT